MSVIKKSKNGIDYLIDILKEKPRTITRATLWKILHQNSSKEDVCLKIGRYNKKDFLVEELENPNPKSELTLDDDEFNKLIEFLIYNYKPFKSGLEKYVCYNSEENDVIVVNDENKKEVIDSLISNGYSDDFWNALKDSDFQLANKITIGNIKIEKDKILKELHDRLENGNFSETIGDESWQKWIYANNWIFGINYRIPIEKARINLNGIMPDFLFPTVDGFLDILEIKLPGENVIIEDSSHTGSFRWSAKTNEAIGQVVNYLNEMERLQSEIEREYKRVYNKDISTIKPRAFILIGKSNNWSLVKKEGLRKLNYTLHGIEVLTYSDLEKRGESIINFYENNS